MAVIICHQHPQGYYRYYCCQLTCFHHDYMIVGHFLVSAVDVTHTHPPQRLTIFSLFLLNEANDNALQPGKSGQVAGHLSGSFHDCGWWTHAFLPVPWASQAGAPAQHQGRGWNGVQSSGAGGCPACGPKWDGVSHAEHCSLVGAAFRFAWLKVGLVMYIQYMLNVSRVCEWSSYALEYLFRNIFVF